MRVRLAIGLAGTLLLAGCGSGDADKGGGSVALENASIGEARTQARDALKLQPGQWEVAVNIVKVDIPGAPPEVAGAMGEAMGKRGRTLSHCITPEEASRPPEEMMGGDSGQCRYENFTMAGGRINATMLCRAGQGDGETRMVMAGAYSPTSYDMDLTMTLSGAMVPTGQAMTMQAKQTARRTGECSAT